MAFLGIGKKKRVVPDELPDLISDEIENESNKELGSFLKEEELKKEIIAEPKEEVKAAPEVNNREVINRRKEVIDRLIKGTEKEGSPEKEEESEKEKEEDKSFFNDLQENISKDINDLDHLEEYSRNLNNGSTLDSMKSYWKKQKAETDIEAMTEDIKEKISKKTERMQSLEREWQRVYFELMEKEDAIKEEEKELKDTIKEFVKICRNKKNDLYSKNAPKLSEGENESKNKNKNKNKSKKNKNRR